MLKQRPPVTDHHSDNYCYLFEKQHIYEAPSYENTSIQIPNATRGRFSPAGQVACLDKAQ